MQRYFVPPGQFQPHEVTVAGEDARHLVKVLRSRVGDRFIAADGQGREVLAEIAEIGRDEVRAVILEERKPTPEPKVSIWVAQSLPKADKMDTILQKGTEIGVARFLPFRSARTIVQYDDRKEEKRTERWRKIIKEAAEQAHRSRMPDVAAPVSWKELLGIVPRTELAMICYEKESANGIKALLKRHAAGRGPTQGPLMIIIGPEGGFDEREVDEALAAGCEAVSLGPRILRTETAALVAAAAILYEYDEMGGS
jgi:16S rRNA (uracil1498-N3)-methyltransferase